MSAIWPVASSQFHVWDFFGVQVVNLPHLTISQSSLCQMSHLLILPQLIGYQNFLGNASTQCTRDYPYIHVRKLSTATHVFNPNIEQLRQMSLQFRDRLCLKLERNTGRQLMSSFGLCIYVNRCVLTQTWM